MDSILYYQIQRYLQNSYTSHQLEETQKKKIIRIGKMLELEQELLYKRNKNEPSWLLRIVQKPKIGAILMMAHTHPLGGHFRVEAIYNKIRCIYYWPRMLEDIRKYIRTCNECQRRGKTNLKDLFTRFQY